MTSRRRCAALLVILLSALRTCCSTPAFAEPCAKMQAVIPGQVSTCDGILWPAPWTVEALRCVRVDLPSCKASLQHEQTVCSADRLAAEERVSAAQALAQERLQLLEQALNIPTERPAPAPSWTASPWVVFVAGAAAGGALASGAWYLLGR